MLNVYLNDFDNFAFVFQKSIHYTQNLLEIQFHNFIHHYS